MMRLFFNYVFLFSIVMGSSASFAQCGSCQSLQGCSPCASSSNSSSVFQGISTDNISANFSQGDRVRHGGTSGTYRYANDGRRTLHNLLMAPDGFLSARGTDNTFHDIRIDESGRMLRASGQEFQSSKTLNEFHDYILGNRLDNNALFRAFVRHYFPDSSQPQGDSDPNNAAPLVPGLSVEAPGSHSTPTPKGTSPSGPAQSLQQAQDGTNADEALSPAPILPEQQIETPEVKTAGQDSSPAKKPISFQLVAHGGIARNARLGNQTAKVPSGDCGSTPVSKTKLADGTCEIGFITAGHCVPTEADYFYNGSPQQHILRAVTLGENLGKKLEVEAKNIRVLFPSNYRGRERRKNLSNGRVVSESIESADDAALVLIKTQCDYVADGQLSKLAQTNLPIASDGDFRGGNLTLTAELNNGTSVEGSVKGFMSGPDVRFSHNKWKVVGNKFIQSGNSGSPIRNERNEITGVVSVVFKSGRPGDPNSGNFKNKAGETIHYSRSWGFSPNVLAWAHQTLNTRKQAIAQLQAQSQPQTRGIAQSPRAPASQAGSSGAVVSKPDLSKVQLRAQDFAHTGLSSAEINQHIRAIDSYRRLSYGGGEQRYRFGHNPNPNNYHEYGVFSDVPEGGTGKLILGYFGPPDPNLESQAKAYPWVEVQPYPYGSQEHTSPTNAGGKAVGFDAMGRKITRYMYDPKQALQSLANSPDAKMLSSYNNAVRALFTTPKKQTPPQLAKSHNTQEAAETEAKATQPESHSRPITPRPELSLPNLDVDESEYAKLIGNNCMKCHNGTELRDSSEGTPFPTFVQNWSQFKRLLEKRDPNALMWLAKLSSQVVHGSMLNRAGLNKHSGDGAKLTSFIAKKASAHGLAVPPTSLTKKRETGNLGSEHASFMINPTKKSEYFEVLRNAGVNDPQMLKTLLEFDAIWDHDGAPIMSWAVADGDSGHRGARPINFTKPADPPLPYIFKSANGKWNWKEPFDEGFSIDQNTQGLDRFFMVRFPRDAKGNLIKGVRGKESRGRTLNMISSSGYSGIGDSDELPSPWASFPPGTKVVEVLYTKSLGKPVPIDIMVREKFISADGQKAVWKPNAYRQDSSPEKIERWVKSQPGWNDPKTENYKDYQAMLRSLSNPVQDAVVSELGPQGNLRPFKIDGQSTNVIRGSKSAVRGVDPNILLKMYQEVPMDSALGSTGWQFEPQDVFKGSHRGIPINAKTCNNCHRFSGESFRDVITASGGSYTGAVSSYGNGPGYDSVLAGPWSSIAEMAKYRSSSPRTSTDQSMRPEWGKFFEDYSSGKHNESYYRRTEQWAVSNNPLRSKY